VQGQAEDYLDAVAAGRRAAKARSTVWNPNYKNWRRVNANHQRQPAVRKIESIGQLIQAGMPRLSPEFFGAINSFEAFQWAASKKRSSAGALSFLQARSY